MEVVVGNDADARAAGPQRNQPRPVALAHQVVRAEPALTGWHPRLPGRIPGPVVDFHSLLDAEPCGVGAVRHRSRQPELTPNQAAPAAGIDQPPGLHGAGAAWTREFDGVRAPLQLDALHRAVVDDLHAGIAYGRQQPVLETATVELKRRHGRKRRRSKLGPTADVVVRSLRKEVPETKLLEMLRTEHRLQLEDAPEVVRADLDARFTDLECGLAHRMEAFLQYQHAHVRRLHVQLPRQSQPGEPATCNHGVVGRMHRA